MCVRGEQRIVASRRCELPPLGVAENPAKLRVGNRSGRGIIDAAKQLKRLAVVYLLPIGEHLGEGEEHYRTVSLGHRASVAAQNVIGADMKVLLLPERGRLLARLGRR